jgi:hypothetical protein
MRVTRAMAAVLLTIGCFPLGGCSDDGSGSGGSGGAASGAGAASGSPSGSGAAGASGAGASGGGGGGTTGGAGGDAPAEVTGYWVWTKQIENDQVTLEITDADMEGKVGPSGWPGCPEGIICTRYGIQKVAFGETGALHYQHNVTTSSDFQTLGTWADASAGHGTLERTAQFSCAHPEQVNADVVPGGFRYQFVDGELRLGVTDFGSFPLYDDGTEPTRWMAYKAVTRADYYGKYMIRICQPHDGFECHPGCFDDSLVDEP